MSAASQAPEMASALGLLCQGIVAVAVMATAKSVITTIITDVLKRILFFSFGCMFERYTGSAFTRNYESFTRIAARLLISDGFAHWTTRGMPGRQKTGDRPQTDRDSQPDQWTARLEKEIQTDIEHDLYQQVADRPA